MRIEGGAQTDDGGADGCGADPGLEGVIATQPGERRKEVEDEFGLAKRAHCILVRGRELCRAGGAADHDQSEDADCAECPEVNRRHRRIDEQGDLGDEEAEHDSVDNQTDDVAQGRRPGFVAGDEQEDTERNHAREKESGRHQERLEKRDAAHQIGEREDGHGESDRDEHEQGRREQFAGDDVCWRQHRDELKSHLFLLRFRGGLEGGVER